MFSHIISHSKKKPEQASSTVNANASQLNDGLFKKIYAQLARKSGASHIVVLCILVCLYFPAFLDKTR